MSNKSFWTQAPARSGAASVDTLIGRQTEVMGDVRFSGGLHIDGKVTGKINAIAEKGATLSVSESGLIEGNVRAPHIVLNGQVHGDVVCSEHISLGAHARIVGNVYYKNVEMAGGAVINGQLVHEGDEAISAPRAHNEQYIEAVAIEGQVKVK